jgi:hypothetical protein
MQPRGGRPGHGPARLRPRTTKRALAHVGALDSSASHSLRSDQHPRADHSDGLIRIDAVELVLGCLGG